MNRYSTFRYLYATLVRNLKLICFGKWEQPRIVPNNLPSYFHEKETLLGWKNPFRSCRSQYRVASAAFCKVEVMGLGSQVGDGTTVALGTMAVSPGSWIASSLILGTSWSDTTNR